MYVCVCVRVCVCVCVYLRACVHAYMRACVHKVLVYTLLIKLHNSHEEKQVFDQLYESLYLTFGYCETFFI